MSETDYQSDEDNGQIIYTAHEILSIGLHLVGFKECRIERASMITNIEQFWGHYGSNPNVCAQIFEDLQSTNVEEAYISPNEINI